MDKKTWSVIRKSILKMDGVVGISLSDSDGNNCPLVVHLDDSADAMAIETLIRALFIQRGIMDRIVTFTREDE